MYYFAFYGVPGLGTLLVLHLTEKAILKKKANPVPRPVF